MKSNRFTLLISLVPALLGSCIGAGRACAQGRTGAFNLPFEAHWGLATLPPGDYWFKLEPPEGLLLLYRGNRPVAIVHAQTFANKVSGRSTLIVVNEKGGATVRELLLPRIGMALYYAPYKPKHGSAVEDRPAGADIPIAVTPAHTDQSR